MDNIRLPLHVIDRLENRWAGRPQQEAKTRRFQSRHLQTKTARPARLARPDSSNGEF
jgi:hypothetical protein